jgi:CRISPR system Cascade subunit CasA
MEGRDGHVVARTTPTKAAFLQAKEQRGDTGDVWAPVRLASGALSVTDAGFTYRLLADILFSGDFRWKPALQFRQQDGEEPVVVAQVLARGEGETNGYHQRLVPIPAEAHRRLLTVQPETLGSLAKDRIERVRLVQTSVLKPALCALLQGGREELDFRDRRVQPWLDRFDAEVDRVFFEDLWEALAMTNEDRQHTWDQRLRTLAWDQLDHAMETAPVPLAHRPKARARAELVFRGTARNRGLWLPPRTDPAPTDSSAEVE